MRRTLARRAFRWIGFVLLGSCFTVAGWAVASGSAADYLEMGYTYFGLGWGELGVEQFRQAARLDPNSADAQLLVAMALDVAGREEDAIAAYHRAASLSPLGHSIDALAGDRYLKSGAWDLAEQEYQRALAAAPDSVLALYGLGLIAEHRGDDAAAAPRFRRVIELAPDKTAAYVALGRLLRGQGKVDEALTVLKKAQLTGSRLPALHVELGLAYEAQGKRAAALDALRWALTLDPTSREAADALRRIESPQGPAES